MYFPCPKLNRKSVNICSYSGILPYPAIKTNTGVLNESHTKVNELLIVNALNINFKRQLLILSRNWRLYILCTSKRKTCKCQIGRWDNYIWTLKQNIKGIFHKGSLFDIYSSQLNTSFITIWNLIWAIAIPNSLDILYISGVWDFVGIKTIKKSVKKLCCYQLSKKKVNKI